MSIFGEKIKKLGSENVFFDYMDEAPIRCFYSPILSKSFKKDDYLIDYNYGDNRRFEIGDELPVNTMWYNYPRNLMILVLKDNECKVHIVKDGILSDSKDILEIDDNVFREINAVIDRDGQFINVNSSEEMNLYIKDMYRHKEIVEGLDTYNDYLIGQLNLTHMSLRTLSSMTCLKSIICFIKSDDVGDINKYLYKKFMTKPMSVFEIKSFFLLNECLFNKKDLIILKTILRKKYELLYIDLDIKYEEHFSLYVKQVSLNEEYLEKRWNVEVKFEKEKRLGELLECLKWAVENRDDYFFTEEMMDEYIGWSLKEIDKLLEDNIDLICKYKEWSSFFKNNEFEVNSILNLIKNYKIKK